MSNTDSYRIGFICRHDLEDKSAGSGVPYSMAKALGRHCGEVIPLAPLRLPFRQLRRGMKAFLVYFLKKNWDYERTEEVSLSYAKQVAAMLKRQSLDVLFAPMGAIPLANLESKMPVVYFSDASYAAMLGFYPGFTGFFKSHIRIGHQLERQALQRSNLAVFSSSWAADSACAHYSLDQAKTRVIPLGANLETIPPIQQMANKLRTSQCRLLFLGVD